MQGKNLKLYFENHPVVKVAMVLVIMSICVPTDVCSNTIYPWSFLGRTSGRINNHLMDKFVNLARNGKNFHPVCGSRTELLDINQSLLVIYIPHNTFFLLLFTRKIRRWYPCSSQCRSLIKLSGNYLGMDSENKVNCYDINKINTN